MRKIVCSILWFVVIGGLVSCNMPVRFNPGASKNGIEQQYQAVSALLTETSNAGSSSTPEPVVQSTLVFSSARTAIPATASPVDAPTVEGTENSPVTATRVVTSPGGQAIAAPCDWVQPGHPLDVSVPDDTRFHPGEYFSKTWRLVNTGSCPWTRDYAMVWFSGNDLGLNQTQPFSQVVHSGGSVDVTVEMVAPQTPGTYQSNWKMRNPQGVLFGIGPKGDAPLWVRIVVVAVDTPTVTPEIPTTTPVPVVYASGSLSLVLNEGLDLDSAQKNQAENDDVTFASPAEGQYQLAALNEVQLIPYGISEPQQADCQQAAVSKEPVPLSPGQVGTYLCYRTTKDLPGRMLIRAMDVASGRLDLEFVTWAVP